MSEGEDDFMCEDEEDYGLEYSEDSNSEPDVDLENQYYNSKALKEDEPKAALTSFQRVLDLEGGEKGEWGFKALKQMIKINFKLSNFKEMMVRYKQLLTYIKSAVTRNHSEKSINSILDYISTSKNMELLQDFYETTLEALKDAKNDRLWFKTNTKLGKLYYDRKDYTKLAKILKQLHQSCQTDDGEDDLKKGTQLLEIYALEIQMYTEQKNNKKLKALYEQSLHIKSAIPHPLIMGVIRECGGKMHLREGEFEKAHTDFFEAFKNYDESGSPRRTTCLKYLVLANMLMKSGINPFDSQEAKPYKNDPEILAMTNLVNAYQTNDINEFELILKQNRQNIMDDPFIREHIEDLLRNIRTQVLIKLINPYTRIHIPHISMELNIDVTEVENLLVSCILDSLRNCATLEYLSETPAQHPQTFDLNIQHHADHPFVTTVALLTSPYDESIILTCSKSAIMRNAKCILDQVRIARHTIRLPVDTAVGLLGLRRFLFEAGDILFSGKTLNCPVSALPSTFSIILKMLSDIYQDKAYRVYLCNDSAIREVTDLKSDGFTDLKDVNLNILFHYLHIPFVSQKERIVCHFLDIYEISYLPNSSNYQVLVYPITTDKCFPDSVYDSFINPEQSTFDDNTVFDQIALF